MSASTVGECHSCGKNAKLVHITAEDIQRTRPPLISMVCEECRDWLRAAARLETSYSTRVAVKELTLMVLAGFFLLFLWSSIISRLHISFTFGTVGIVLLVPAVVLFSGLRIAYGVVKDRYSFTHNLAWSLHSRVAMTGIAIILSGILAIIFHGVLT